MSISNNFEEDSTQKEDANFAGLSMKIEKKAKTASNNFFFLHSNQKKEIMKNRKFSERDDDRSFSTLTDFFFVNLKMVYQKKRFQKFEGDINSLRVMTDEDRQRFKRTSTCISSSALPWPGEIFGSEQHVRSLKNKFDQCSGNSYYPNQDLFLKKQELISNNNDLNLSYFDVPKKSCHTCKSIPLDTSLALSCDKSVHSEIESCNCTLGTLYKPMGSNSKEYWEKVRESKKDNQKPNLRIIDKIINSIDKGRTKTPKSNYQLFSKKYAPINSKDVLGNTKVIQDISLWLKLNLLRNKVSSESANECIPETGLDIEQQKVATTTTSCLKESKINNTQTVFSNTFNIKSVDIQSCNSVESSHDNSPIITPISIEIDTEVNINDISVSQCSTPDNNFFSKKKYVKKSKPKPSLEKQHSSQSSDSNINDRKKASSKNKSITGTDDLRDSIVQLFGESGFSQEEIDYFLNYSANSLEKVTGRKHEFGLPKSKSAKGQKGKKISSQINKDLVTRAVQSECGIILLFGPSGSGKTSAVYSIAEELDYMVHEIHAGDLRSGKAIVSKLDELVKSHVLSSKANFFQKNLGKKTENSVSGAETKSEPKQVLVLLQHIDILFEQDSGMISAVQMIAQKSKRPIIATCSNKLDPNVYKLDLTNYFEYKNPSVVELVEYLNLIFFNESGYMISENLLADTCIFNNCNLSKLMVWAENFIRTIKYSDEINSESHELGCTLSKSRNKTRNSSQDTANNENRCQNLYTQLNVVPYSKNSGFETPADKKHRCVSTTSDTFSKRLLTTRGIPSCTECDLYSMWVNYLNFETFSHLDVNNSQYNSKRGHFISYEKNEESESNSKQLNNLKLLEKYSDSLDNLLLSDTFISSCPEEQEAFFESDLYKQNDSLFPDALQNTKYLTLDYDMFKKEASFSVDTLQIPLYYFLVSQMDFLGASALLQQEQNSQGNKGSICRDSEIISPWISRPSPSIKQDLLEVYQNTSIQNIGPDDSGTDGTKESSSETCEQKSVLIENSIESLSKILTNGDPLVELLHYNTKIEYISFIKHILALDAIAAKSIRKYFEAQSVNDDSSEEEPSLDAFLENEPQDVRQLILRQFGAERRFTRSKKTTYTHYMNWIEFDLLCYINDNHFLSIV
ncbi:hypothetical protein BB560_000931 [Smittium megazygosporum]|uniref:ATPase AAA-type core domain-containing protein n=1 Tax=Smittium megazygosporum TaxID=133381 RepID=A0A2T9ZJ12_9FUNG|nr:hypothetical protein BB560_000931 [Smittium megazygosporum]